MDSIETTEPKFINSLYRHGVDAKRRIQIPAKWRPSTPGTELTLMVWPKGPHGACLRALPPQTMAKLVRDVDAMPNSDPNKGVLKRFFGSGSEQVTLDTVGRICLPEKMAKEAGIGEQAVLVGMLDRFEIWSPARYEQLQASEAVLAQEALKLME